MFKHYFIIRPFPDPEPVMPRVASKSPAKFAPYDNRLKDLCACTPIFLSVHAHSVDDNYTRVVLIAGAR